MKHLIFLFIFLLGQQVALAQEIARIGYAERGKASFYPDNRSGAFTRSGEVYDMKAMEAAHKFIAFNSLVKVTHLATQRSIVVRINDRPFTDQYVTVLTKAAAEALGIKGSEVEVTLEVIALGVPRNPADQVAATVRDQPAPEKEPGRDYYDNEDAPAEKGYLNTTAKPEATTRSLVNPAKPDPNLRASSTNKAKPAIVAKPTGKASVQDQKKITNLKESVHKTIDQAKTSNAQVAKAAKTTDKKTGAKNETPFAPGGTYSLKGEKVRPAGYGLQVVAFSEVDKAIVEAKKLERQKLGKLFIQSGWTSGKKNYRVLLGTYLTKAEADKAAANLKKKKIATIIKKHFEE
jgi:rare lipoprotein A (peptidoglycan hydrolase)